MPAGTVKWYSPEKGYGLIATDGDGKEVMVMEGEVKASGFRTLESGQRVFFRMGYPRKSKEFMAASRAVAKALETKPPLSATKLRRENLLDRLFQARRSKTR